jgi:Zn-dependent protease with chaperone function
MDFFARQDSARKKTKLLVFYFVVAVILIVALNYLVALVAFNGVQTHQHNNARYEQTPPIVLWSPQIFLGSTLLTLAIISIGSVFKISALAGGGSVVAESMGGRLLSSNTTNPDERKLLNVVEEMAIASGVPMPKVYVLDNEEGINAFAAGHTTGDAAVAVTRNCMTKLSRDELQGVIGHEFSHILNGDMRLNIQLMGVLFGILCLATVGRILLYMRSSNSRDKNPLPLIGIALLIIGSVGVFFGRLIQSAVSRQREYLADASSVQFTRNPAGLSGALQKLGGYGSRMHSPNAPDAGHLFFGNGLSAAFLGAFATHPPLEDRIRAIDPAWDGKFKRLTEDKPENIYHRDPSRPPMPDAFGTVLGGAICSGDDARPPVIQSHSVLPNLGNPTPLHLEYAEKLRNALPESVKAATREPLDSVALIYAMLLSPDETIRATQLAELAKRVTPDIYGKTVTLFPDVSTAVAHAHLPMINIALGALRQLTAEQFAQFSKTLQWLIQSDGKVELFEFVLQKIILRNLAPQFGGVRPPVVQYYTIKPLVPDCVIVLSALAYVGGNNADVVGKAFAAGAPYLRAPNDVAVTLLPLDQCRLTQIDPALNRLAQAVPTIKKNLIDACVHVVVADGVIQEAEAELLRAIADTLDCPMPPFLPAE